MRVFCFYDKERKETITHVLLEINQYYIKAALSKSVYLQRKYNPEKSESPVKKLPLTKSHHSILT